MQVIAHNILAQFTSRQLNINTKSKEKTSEKLLSGYRINRSADDAAGLQISEKMIWQIRGLGKGANNVQDGVSILQAANDTDKYYDINWEIANTGSREAASVHLRIVLDTQK